VVVVVMVTLCGMLKVGAWPCFFVTNCFAARLGGQSGTRQHPHRYLAGSPVMGGVAGEVAGPQMYLD
jgi:hypothetical protein